MRTEDRLNETIISRAEGELKLLSRINPDEERIGKIGVSSKETECRLLTITTDYELRIKIYELRIKN